MNKNLNSVDLKNHYLAEVVFNTLDAGQRYLIGDIPQLRNVKIKVIQAHSSATFQNSINGRSVIDFHIKFTGRTVIGRNIHSD